MYKQIRVDDNTWAFEAVMDDGDSVRFFLLDAQDSALVIDSGYLDMDVRALAAEVLESENRSTKPDGSAKPVLLANTHGDMDHTGGNASFEVFYMTQKDYEVFNMQERCPNSKHIAAEEGTVIDLGGRQLQYIMVPGHTWGNAAILDITNRTLFPGDIIQTNNMFMFGPNRCPEKMAGSLRKLNTFRDRFDKIYACHGQMILPADAVDKVIEAWDMVLNGTAPTEPRNVIGCDIIMHKCGYCNFFCD